MRSTGGVDRAGFEKVGFWRRPVYRRRYAINAVGERKKMNAFALLVGIVLVGIAAQAVAVVVRTGRLELSRFWYLALGLVLMLPTMSYPLALVREIQNPNPRIDAFNLPLTLAWVLGLYLVIRFVTSTPREARVGNVA
jgi:hypothetical protein